MIALDTASMAPPAVGPPAGCDVKSIHLPDFLEDLPAIEVSDSVGHKGFNHGIRNFTREKLSDQSRNEIFTTKTLAAAGPLWKYLRHMWPNHGLNSRPGHMA